MTGASLARSRRCSTKSLAAAVSASSASVSCCSSPSSARASAASISDSTPIAGLTRRPLARRRARSANSSCGVAITTCRTSSRTSSGRMRWVRKNDGATCLTIGGTAGKASASTSGRRSCAASAVAMSSSDTSPRRTSTRPSRPPVSRCAVSARSRSRAESLPSATRRCPSRTRSSATSVDDCSAISKVDSATVGAPAIRRHGGPTRSRGSIAGRRH